MYIQTVDLTYSPSNRHPQRPSRADNLNNSFHAKDSGYRQEDQVPNVSTERHRHGTRMNLCPLGETLVLELGVVGVTGTDAGEVVALDQLGMFLFAVGVGIIRRFSDTYRTTRSSRRWCRNL